MLGTVLARAPYIVHAPSHYPSWLGLTLACVAVASECVIPKKVHFLAVISGHVINQDSEVAPYLHHQHYLVAVTTFYNVTGSKKQKANLPSKEREGSGYSVFG